jgi:hypothetical protein
MTKFCVGKTYRKETGRKISRNTKCLAVVESAIHGPCIVMEDSDYVIWNFYLQDYERGDVVKMSEYKAPIVHQSWVVWLTNGAATWAEIWQFKPPSVGTSSNGKKFLSVKLVSYTEIP